VRNGSNFVWNSYTPYFNIKWTVHSTELICFNLFNKTLFVAFQTRGIKYKCFIFSMFFFFVRCKILFSCHEKIFSTRNKYVNFNLFIKTISFLDAIFWTRNKKQLNKRSFFSVLNNANFVLYVMKFFCMQLGMNRNCLFHLKRWEF